MTLLSFPSVVNPSVKTPIWTTTTKQNKQIKQTI
jgi:hypothetical protein